MRAKEEAEELLADYDCDCIGLATAIKQKLEARDKEIERLRVYELRGEALKRPCPKCGYQPAEIKLNKSKARDSE